MANMEINQTSIAPGTTRRPGKYNAAVGCYALASCGVVNLRDLPAETSANRKQHKEDSYAFRAARWRAEKLLHA